LGEATPWIEVFRSESRKAAEEHLLVLEARSIPSGLAEMRGAFVVVVPLGDAARARAELETFLRENRGGTSGTEPLPAVRLGVFAAAAYAFILLLFDVARRREALGLDWWKAGCADAALIRGGAWWRSLTALFLHADAAHLAGNLLFGALFGVMLAQSVGFGLAWLGFVVTGGLGNGLNAWLQSRPHVSVGASTAVFGMLGIQVAFDWLRRRELHARRFLRWAPLAMGVALLGWLGGGVAHPADPDTPVERVDVLAHVLGFASGLALGAALGVARERIATVASAQTALAATALGAVVLAWVAAFR